jgi:hypothetical protein
VSCSKITAEEKPLKAVGFEDQPNIPRKPKKEPPPSTNGATKHSLDDGVAEVVSKKRERSVEIDGPEPKKLKQVTNGTDKAVGTNGAVVIADDSGAIVIED